MFPEILETLSNREIATAIWLAVFLGWSLSKKKIRRSLWSLIRVATKPRLLLLPGLGLPYMYAVVMGLRWLGLWDITDLKDTILWLLTAGLVMIADVVGSWREDGFYRKTFFDGLKVSVLLEFFLNMFSFPLLAELVFVPAMVFIGVMLVFLEREPSKEYGIVRNFFLGCQTLAGLTVVALASYGLLTQAEEVFSLSTLLNFLLPILLTVLFFPLVFGFSVYSAYETSFVRLRFLLKDEDVRRFAKRRALRRFKFNVWCLGKWMKHIESHRPHTQDEIRTSFMDFDCSD